MNKKTDARNWMGRMSRWFMSHLPFVQKRDIELARQARSRHDLLRVPHIAEMEADEMAMQLMELRRKFYERDDTDLGERRDN